MNDTAHEKIDPWQNALAAIAAPLRFAARHEFSQLDRIKDLENTLQRGIARARQLLPPSSATRHHQALQELAAAVPQPAASAQARRAGLRMCVMRLEALLRAGPPSVAPMPPSRPKAAAPPLARSAPPAAPSTLTRSTPPVPPPARAPAPPKTSAPAPPKTRAAALGAAAPSRPATGDADSPRPESPLQFLRGVGPKVAAHLAKRGLKTVEDLLRFLPRRYQGLDSFEALGALQVGSVASVQAQVYNVQYQQRRARRTLEVILRDATGFLHLMWFRIPHRNFAEQFVRGAEIRAVGQVKGYRARMQIIHPEITVLAEGPAADAPVSGGVSDNSRAPAGDAVVPLYLEVDGMRPIAVRKVIALALPAAAHVSDPLPQGLRRGRGLVAVGEALAHLHQPPGDAPVAGLNSMDNPWHRRLIYEELLFLQLALLQQRAAQADGDAPAMAAMQPLAAVARQILPFTLTGAQSRVLEEVEGDLRSSRPMQRLVQGDVGSGKTAVAFAAMAGVAKQGWQTAMLAPTELLAEQHLRNALKFLEPQGLRVGLLTGKISTRERRAVLAALADHGIDVVIGTHALLQDRVVFARLGLGVIDEQHRFGVLQRARLQELAQSSGKTPAPTPHMLVMTATPIPRTLALTVYGDLDVSKIDALPPGRTPVATHVCFEGQRPTVYDRVRAAVHAGQQAYVVFPLVEESDKEGMEQLRDAIGSAEELAHGQLHDLRVGLLHGRMSGDDKDRIMRAFAAHEVDVLVATTVIEVGIDVPRATVMVIEHAERFGLSQLHQLRGRVGRGADASSCYLLAQCKRGSDAWQRLHIMEQTNDGFAIAEEDLQIRGMGDVVGTRQAGLPMLSLANLARDHALLEHARADAQALLRQDPTLSDAHHKALREQLMRMAGGALRLAKVG